MASYIGLYFPAPQPNQNTLYPGALYHTGLAPFGEALPGHERLSCSYTRALQATMKKNLNIEDGFWRPMKPGSSLRRCVVDVRGCGISHACRADTFHVQIIKYQRSSMEVSNLGLVPSH